MIRLQCLKGCWENRIFEFDSPSIIIGRGEDCDLSIDDESCSRHHARIEEQVDSFVANDLKSTNGLFLNKNPIQKSNIKYGDKLTIGRNIFIFLSEIIHKDDSNIIDEEAVIHDTVTSIEAEKNFLLFDESLLVNKPGKEKEKKETPEDLRRKNHEMYVLFQLGQAINKTLNLDDLYTFIANCLYENIAGVERLYIYIKKSDADSLKLVKSLSKKANEQFPVSNTILRHVMKKKVGILASDVRDDDRFSQQESVILSNLRSFICVPLITNDKLIGVIYAENCRRCGCFTKDHLILLTAAGSLTAVAINNAFLYEKLQISFYETMCSLSNALEAKDKYTGGHSERVARYAVGIAKQLNFSKKKIKKIRFAAELHDIGKIAIKEKIIDKKKRLTDEEFEIIKKHPQLGVKILEPIHFLEPVLPFILHHHERLDGTGYPDGLAGDEIPLEARILNLADAFDAMTTQRPYNKPKTYPRALEQCWKEAGKSFDKDCVKALQEFMGNMTFVASMQVEELA